MFRDCDCVLLDRGGGAYGMRTRSKERSEERDVEG